MQGAHMVLYQDGSVVASADDAHEPRWMTRANNWIGRSNFRGDNFFEGAIKSVQIWTRALQPYEVANLAELGAACQTAPPTVTPQPSVTPLPTAAPTNAPRGR